MTRRAQSRGSLASAGVSYAEIYVSPEIATRLGLDAAACLAEIDRGFRESEDGGAPRCRILLDAVRQWGPESAERVLDLHERTALPSVVGFGLGGDESSVPAAAFAGVYARARALDLRTSVHAGEWGGADSLSEALDHLRPDRVDHGIAAAFDEHLLQRLADEETTLWVSPTSNLRDGRNRDASNASTAPTPGRGGPRHDRPDDPLIFGTTTAREHELLREWFGFGERTLRLLAENSWQAAFCTAADSATARSGISLVRRPVRSRPQPSVPS